MDLKVLRWIHTDENGVITTLPSFASAMGYAGYTGNKPGNNIHAEWREAKSQEEYEARLIIKADVSLHNPLRSIK